MIERNLDWIADWKPSRDLRLERDDLIHQVRALRQRYAALGEQIDALALARREAFDTIRHLEDRIDSIERDLSVRADVRRHVRE